MADNVHVAMESSGDQIVLRLYNDYKRHLLIFYNLRFTCRTFYNQVMLLLP